MIPIKALLTGLVGTSLCMANISGIVTDTGTTPVVGAVVKLEKGRQTATTGADGRFTIDVSNTALPDNGRLLPNGFSARISGNMLIVTIAERTAVEVMTFDLRGKALSTALQIMDAGKHSIALPQQGAGIYFYTVKAKNNTFLLKGNSVEGKTFGSSISTQGSSLKPLAKKVMSATTINDVIAVTKLGYLNYRVIVINSDTSDIKIKMIVCEDTVTDTDGNVYQAVRIGKQVWTVVNLRTTKYNDGSPIPLVTDSATWSELTTPGYCYYNNTSNSDSIEKFGALYNWYVVNPLNPSKIAPLGWHVPTDTEWTTLEKYLVKNGYNWDGTIDTTAYNKIAKSMASKTDWVTSSSIGAIGCDLTINNLSGFSALPCGFRYNIDNFNIIGNFGIWWSATSLDSSSAWRRSIMFDHDNLDRNDNFMRFGFSVRLLRDN